MLPNIKASSLVQMPGDGDWHTSTSRLSQRGGTSSLNVRRCKPPMSSCRLAGAATGAETCCTQTWRVMIRSRAAPDKTYFSGTGSLKEATQPRRRCARGCLRLLQVLRQVRCPHAAASVHAAAVQTCMQASSAQAMIQEEGKRHIC